MTEKYHEGDEVFWIDPEGETTGTYKVVKRLTDSGRDSIWLITNGFSEAEVYQYELS